MIFKERNERANGIGFAAGAYLLWGILPVYWKLLQNVSSIEVLAHRVIWSFIFLLIILIITRKLQPFLSEVREITRLPRKMLGIIITTIMINLNWFLYIWAVNQNHIIQTSLGYYINPLVSVLLGIFFLKERLSLWQLFAFLLAIVGVSSLTLQYGAFPWVALTLAISFGLYGLLKKVINIGSITGLTLETLVSCIFALAYLGYVYNTGNGAFKLSLSPTTLLLIGAGAVTATPLILFAAGARRLPLFVIGFLQYISPTIGLILGIFIYHEPFTRGHLISFVVIWGGLIIFSLARMPLLVGLEEKIIIRIDQMLAIRKRKNAL
ncbi:MAG: EamA family transporter RarD [Firmicutes bacterium HGW-Firmicutes-15]|nr:MAG: EamA family transporter RarD [Firmicutes bacterium HGW-Firmicutes-15]